MVRACSSLQVDVPQTRTVNPLVVQILEPPMLESAQLRLPLCRMGKLDVASWILMQLPLLLLLKRKLQSKVLDFDVGQSRKTRSEGRGSF